MEFRIADTFTDSLARLTAQEQKAAKTTAFDLQLDPSAPGLSFHKLDRARDTNFWSVRVNADIRLIVHRTASSILLVYVDHHDAAYKWAERRKIERHPTTGAMQLVEIRERVEDIVVARPPPGVPDEGWPGLTPRRLFDHLAMAQLMAFGVPAEWIDDVRAATEDSLFEIIEHLPQEAQEALLKLAVGEQPVLPETMGYGTNPFAHPDARRRFRVLTNVDELRQALDFPWEKWTVFLHPAQRELVERTHAGSIRVSGSAGTGKTIVALHRAVALAHRHPAARVLLTTFSDALAQALAAKLRLLVGNEPSVATRIIVRSLRGIGHDLYAAAFGPPTLAEPALIQSLLSEAAARSSANFSSHFLFAEWAEVVDAWQLGSWEAYRDVPRLGRRTRLGGRQREALWAIFERVHQGLTANGALTWPGIFARLTEQIVRSAPSPFDFAIVDEAQDLGVAEIRFLAAAGAGRPEALFFAGDLGQRIFQQPFSWRGLGIDVRGRSHTLTINYRTTHQIRTRADRLLPPAIADLDGNSEGRRGTVSVFDGPVPVVRTFNDVNAEREAIGRWIADRLKDGCRLREIGVFVRSDAEIARAWAAASAAGVAAVALSDENAAGIDAVAVGTMHLAKGMEFRAVAVMACDDEVLPLQSRIEAVADGADLEDVYDTERHLLYVACTRARDHLIVTGIAPGSEFLGDLES